VQAPSQLEVASWFWRKSQWFDAK